MKKKNERSKSEINVKKIVVNTDQKAPGSAQQLLSQQSFGKKVLEENSQQKEENTPNFIKPVNDVLLGEQDKVKLNFEEQNSAEKLSERL